MGRIFSLPPDKNYSTADLYNIFDGEIPREITDLVFISPDSATIKEIREQIHAIVDEQIKDYLAHDSVPIESTWTHYKTKGSCYRILDHVWIEKGMIPAVVYYNAHKPRAGTKRFIRPVSEFHDIIDANTGMTRFRQA